MSEYHPKPWTIELPAPEYAKSIARLFAHGWKATYTRPGQDERNRQVQDDAAALLTPDRLARRREVITNLDDTEYMRIAREVGGRGVVAWLYGYNKPAKQELLALYVNPPLHGSGLAREITQGFIDWCDPDRPIDVGVVDDNGRAQNFYRKMGFVATEKTNEFNDYLTEIIMRRPPQGATQ